MGWLCGTSGSVLLAQLCCELVQVFLCFFSAIEERHEEIRLCGRQGLRPHRHGLNVLLERFGFLKSVLDGALEDRLCFCGLLAFFLVCKLRLFLTFGVLECPTTTAPSRCISLGRVWEGFVDEFDADWLKHNIGDEEPDPAGESPPTKRMKIEELPSNENCVM